MRKLIVTLTLALMTVLAVAGAEEETEVYYVLCNPASYVCVRAGAKKSANVEGWLYFGDRVEWDGKRKAGFYHCVGLSTEAGEGWVWKGYLVPDEPVKFSGSATVTANGRVASRRYVKGSRQGWLKPRQTVKVYGYSEEWAVTNRGFVKTKFLELQE